jgi:hypothetical protein
MNLACCSSVLCSNFLMPNCWYWLNALASCGRCLIMWIKQFVRELLCDDQLCSENGQFCAIKEVQVISDDPNSKERLKQLNQVTWFLKSASLVIFLCMVQYLPTCLIDSTICYPFPYWQEVDILRQPSHPNIVQYYGSEMVSFVW